MATTNLNLPTLASSDTASNFPATFNDAMDKLDAFAEASDVNFTVESGITNFLFIRKSGKVVCVNGYIKSSSPISTDSLFVGTIASGYRPTDYVRFPVVIAPQAYSVGNIGYGIIEPDGKLSIKAGSNTSNTSCYFSCSYITS